MIKCLVIDDEQPAIDVLSKFIGDLPNLTLTASTTDIIEAIDLLKAHTFDIIFLDIQMPKLTGLQFLKLYGGTTPVVLTTAYSEFALEGYEYNVIDYLMKPIPFERFIKTIEKYEVIQKRNETLIKENTQDFIFVKTEHKGKIKKINFDDIAYVEGLKNYVSIFTNTREQTVTYIGIGEMEMKLPSERFLRVHRSYIVALKNVEAVDGNEIVMRNAPRIPTAGQYKEALFSRLEGSLVISKNIKG